MSVAPVAARSLATGSEGRRETVEVRVLRDGAALSRAWRVFLTAMVGVAAPAGADEPTLHEPGRTLGAFAGGELIGTAESYAGRLTVPGGARLAHAAVTHVGVLPAHRRRGAAGALLRHQLAELTGRGEIVASLRASEATLYERFGYGAATRSAVHTLDRRRAVVRGDAPEGGPVRVLPATDDVVDRLPAIYDRASGPGDTSDAGAISRHDAWWRLARLRIREARVPTHVALHGPPGDEDGFAVYRAVDPAGWFHARDRGVVVDDLVARSARAHAGLMRHFVALDPVDTVRFAARPVDDPLPWLLTDARAVQTTDVRDETWLRLLDVSAALSARRYRAGAPVVLAVDDPLLSANTGGYRIGPDGAQRTAQTADLALGVSALASVYLGGVTLTTLARAGRVQERRPGALAAADALLATTPEPFAGTGF